MSPSGLGLIERGYFAIEDKAFDWQPLQRIEQLRAC
jgi:hypothetical protein